MFPPLDLYLVYLVPKVIDYKCSTEFQSLYLILMLQLHQLVTQLPMECALFLLLTQNVEKIL
jgi:hypothetical protein